LKEENKKSKMFFFVGISSNCTFFRVLEHCGIIKQARLNTIFFEASEEKIIYFFAKINKDLPGYFLESSHFGYFLK